MNLFLVRHGMVVFNQHDGLKRLEDPSSEWITEKGGTPLLAQGRMQAVLTGKKLAAVDFDAIYVSPLMRTVMTAAEIARQQKTRKYLEIWPELQEARSPSSNLFSKEDMEKVWPYITYPEKMENTCWTGEECGTDELHFEYARAERVIAKIKEKHPGAENILIVSHGMFIEEYLLPVIFGIPPEKKFRYHFWISNCGITKIEFRDNDELAVDTLNETTHLEETSIDKIFC